MSVGLGDLRREVRACWCVERIVESGSLVLRDIGGGRCGEVAAHRLLSSDAVTPDALLMPHAARTAQACHGRRVVVAQDTTEIDLARHRQPVGGLGPTGNAGLQGFFVHAVVAVDAEDEAVLGVAGARIWTRGPEPTPMHHDIPYDDKESRRWLEGSEIAARHLVPEAREVVMVADRESDIYPMFARQPEGVGFIVRAMHSLPRTRSGDRVLAGGVTLFTLPTGWTELGQQEVRVGPKRPGRPARIATVGLKAGKVTIRRPRSAPDKDVAPSLTLGLVEVREAAPPPGETPLVWRLVTTLPVETFDDAREIVRLYRLRWRIEEVFRALKSDGLDIAGSQLRTASRLMNLAALALVAATRILQLVDARDGSGRPATDIIAPDDIAAVATISARLEGRTERQKNPHPQGSLAWLAWTTARLGGWNCYYKPPGPKTMAKGITRLLDKIDGFNSARSGPDV